MQSMQLTLLASKQKDVFLPYVDNYVNSISATLRPISLKIHDNPELNFREYIAHEVITTFLESQKGWEVTRSAYGLETAFVAVFDSGTPGPVISYNAEYDALAGIGHACGHNLIAIVSIGAALAAAAALTHFSLPGKVLIFGTPGEEGGGGKIMLLERGAYTDHKVDISLISHPGPAGDSVLSKTTAYTGFIAEYTGKAAHAAAAPWEGINALDALLLAYNGMSMLRQQTMPGDILQGYITNGGVAPNIIHAYAAGEFVARAATKTRRDILKAQLQNCFHAGASATGATLHFTQLESYDDMVPNLVLGAICRTAFNKLGGAIPAANEELARGGTKVSTDQGNVSYAMPSISLGFGIVSEEGNHNPKFAEAARTRDAHARAMRAAKALAVTGCIVLADDEVLGEARKEWKEAVGRKGDHEELGSI
ncbi:hypothetical protein BJ878DRAFT_334588 [Calycina marina]|uniref:Peptidase M20 domain-containing protein 2 n=1 Tax=Calycina marina TaxID=1763456 RepID=A0A9P8CG26_9HELO|nr:hypothetical protein BJ878DRAFT_334588 [Calycina marina]